MQLKHGETFDAIRKHRGFTLDQLATRSGVGKGYLSRLIRGQKGCRRDTAASIVNALQKEGEPVLTVDQLFIDSIRRRPAAADAAEPAGEQLADTA